MQAGDGFRNQPPYGQVGPLAQGLGEVIDGQRGGGNVRAFRCLGAPGEQQGEKQSNQYFFHSIPYKRKALLLQSL